MELCAYQVNIRFPGKDWICQWKQSFHSLSSSLSFCAFLVSLCLNPPLPTPLTPAYGNCEVAKFLHIWGPMPSFATGFDGRAGGYWDGFLWGHLSVRCQVMRWEVAATLHLGARVGRLLPGVRLHPTGPKIRSIISLQPDQEFLAGAIRFWLQINSSLLFSHHLHMPQWLPTPSRVTFWRQLQCGRPWC